MHHNRPRRIAAFFLVTFSLATHLVAQELVVAENGRAILESGIRQYQNLELRKNSTLFFQGSLSIIANRLVCADGAKIVFSPNGAINPNQTVVFELTAVDASAVESLTLNGNGRNGAGHHAGAKATSGKNGRNATGPSFKYPKGRSSSRGAAGANGAGGRPAENAVQFSLKMQSLKPGAKIDIEAIGGNGGRGQDGGDGGDGGDASSTRSQSGGGAAGHGGNGGKAGNAGRVIAYVVIGPNEIDDKDEILSGVQIAMNYAAGDVGDGGQPGTPGKAGKGSKGPGGKNSPAGAAGRAGGNGAKGSGPERGQKDEQWGFVDAMDLPTFERYLALELKRFRDSSK